LITLTIFDEAYKLWNSSLCNLLQPPVTSSLLGPNILLGTLFSNTITLCYTLNMRERKSINMKYECNHNTSASLFSRPSVSSEMGNTSKLQPSDTLLMSQRLVHFANSNPHPAV
jgi:hypothetical protein